MVCVGRFLASLEMTATRGKQKAFIGGEAADKRPLFSYMQCVMSTGGRHLLKSLQVNNYNESRVEIIN